MTDPDTPTPDPTGDTAPAPGPAQAAPARSGPGDPTPEPDTTTEGDSAAPETGEDDSTEQDEGEDEGEDRSKAGRDAAKYRRALRDVETERDTLRTQIDEYRADAAARIAAAAGLADGADVFEQVAGVGELLDEHGAVDAEKVQTAVAGLIEAKPHRAAPVRPPGGRPQEALVPAGGSDPTAPARSASWSGVLDRANERR